MARLGKRSYIISTIVCLLVLGGLFFFNQINAAATAIDTTVNISEILHSGPSPTVVVTSDTTGYAFYIDSDGRCVYSKSTDINATNPTWGSAVIIDNQTDCIRMAVWYDRWTPGDTTGTYIYIVTADTSVDDLWFNRLDTSSDTVLNGTAPNTISSSPGPVLSNAFATGGNYPSITKATDGVIYAGISDGNGGFIVKCSTTCGTSSNWTNTSAPMGTRSTGVALTQNDNDSLVLVPLSSGDILTVYVSDPNDDLLGMEYDGSAWPTGWTLVDDTAQNNTTYDAAYGVTLDKTTNDVYVAYVSGNATLGGGNDFIETTLFDDSSRSWSAKTNILASESRGITNVKLAFNEDNGDIYAVYSIRATAATSTSTQILSKISTDDMTTWGTESSAINGTDDDFYGLRMNIMSNERLFATWYDVTNDDLTGNTVYDILISNSTYDQSAYRFFAIRCTPSTGKIVKRKIPFPILP